MAKKNLDSYSEVLNLFGKQNNSINLGTDRLMGNELNTSSSLLQLMFKAHKLRDNLPSNT